MYNFPSITLLITHYNRSSSLENLLMSFTALKCHFGNIIVSDDGSKQEHLEHLKKLRGEYKIEILNSTRNRGLGNNINKGQDAVNTEFTLYIQEDFEPTELFPKTLRDALSHIENNRCIDIVRFYAYFQYPYLRPFNGQFSEMNYRPFGLDTNKIYCYSDHPHLRRSDFLEKFGRYAEGVKGDRTEYLMCISFIQNKGRALFYSAFDQLFVQKNTESEPSTMNRSSWRNSKNIFVAFLRHLYRQFKYNFDIVIGVK